MTQGKPCVKEVTRVARELTCVFLLLGICSKLKDSNLDCRCLTWFKFSCILTSLSSNSPLTWPTTNLESEYISTAFLPIFWTMANSVSYSASLFATEKPNLKDFSILIFSGDIRTSPISDPLWFAAPSTYTLQDKGLYRETMPIDFSSMPFFSTFSSNGDSANLATKSLMI